MHDMSSSCNAVCRRQAWSSTCECNSEGFPPGLQRNPKAALKPPIDHYQGTPPALKSNRS
eukprot:4349392-Pyramimonas_sp.AAC.1